MEEPTSPDDILGHARIAREIAAVRVATAESLEECAFPGGAAWR